MNKLSVNYRTESGKTSATYNSWDSMKKRCRDKKRHTYHRYGGRGIKVCTRWLVYENFLFDMGERPNNHTLDRIDTSKDYCKENCRWATPKQQARNRENRTGGTSKYRGVSKRKNSLKWYSSIVINYKSKYLGTYILEVDAAKAYDLAAKKAWGSEAKLNFPDQPSRS